MLGGRQLGRFGGIDWESGQSAIEQADRIGA
jgi:hypothetical protein